MWLGMLSLITQALGFSATLQQRTSIFSASRRTTLSQHQRIMCSSGGGGGKEEMDWRDMRAQLIAQESQAEGGTARESGSYVYESPLIEQGTILLGGTQQDFGFALRQQFFHKCVLLLLQHDDSFTKGIILNRPSAHVVDGWRMWCGHGQVAEGGMFVGAENARGTLEMNALHSVEGPMATRLSQRVIKGVSVTTLEGAKELVEAGEATKEDFWVCVGYSGWAPGQRVSWPVG